jgi:hypothetical protein
VGARHHRRRHGGLGSVESDRTAPGCVCRTGVQVRPNGAPHPQSYSHSPKEHRPILRNRSDLCLDSHLL